MADLPAPLWNIAARIAAFELRLQTRSPVFLIVVGIAALMVTGTLTVDRLQVGPLRTGNRTSVEAVLAIHLVWSLFFLFTAAAFAADAALRDETARSGELVRSTPTRWSQLALGRYGGALGAVLLSFLAVPVAVMVVPIGPWAASLPLPSLAAVAYGILVLAAPNLVLATSVFFALATLARSAMAAYLGAVALLVLYGLGSGAGTGPSTLLLALLDPFGFAALRFATFGRTAGELATTLPPVGGAIAGNRLIWLTVALGAASLALRSQRAVRGSTKSRSAQRPSRMPVPRIAPVARRFDRATARAQFATRTRFEVNRVLRSPFFAVLLLLGLANVVGALTQLPSDAALPEAVARVDDAFRLVPIVVATFWAGELVWGERDAGLDEIIGSCPVPNAAVFLPKVLALVLVLGASLGTAALGAAGLELWRTGAAHLGTWLFGFALPRTFDAGLLAILALFFQAIAPGKLAGLGLMVLYLISALALETMSFNGDVYRYGGASASLSLGQATSPHALLVRAYWGTGAILLAVLAQTLAARGVRARLRTRLRRAAQGPEALPLLGLLAMMALLGATLTLFDNAPL